MVLLKAGRDGRAMGSRVLVSISYGATVFKLRFVKFQVQLINRVQCRAEGILKPRLQQYPERCASYYNNFQIEICFGRTITSILTVSL